MLVGGFVAGRTDLVVAGALGSAADVALRAMLCARLGQPRLGAVLHPLGATMLLGIQWYSLLRNAAGRTSEWRGRRYVTSRPVT